MTVTPAAPATPATPASYAWEATDEELAARFGVPRERVLRFDLNTAPAPPSLVARVLAGGAFEPTLSEYPAADYRALVEAAADAYGVGPDELLVGAGADEVLDVLAKAYLPAGGTAVVAVPTYAMYRVVTEQRGARVVPVPRRPAAEGWALDVEATAAAVSDSGADAVWLCSPNNPTGLAEPDGAVEALLERLDAAPRRGELPLVVLDEAYAEFTGRSLVEIRHRHPNLVVVRTASKAYGLASFRVGFAVAAAATIARLAPYRPPASVSTVSAAVATAAMRDGTAMRAEVARVTRERERLRDGLAAAGWEVGPSMTNFVLARFGTAERAAAVATELQRRGLVPRTFGPSHPLADSLRFTVRDEAGDDRLLEAARELGR